MNDSSLCSETNSLLLEIKAPQQEANFIPVNNQMPLSNIENQSMATQLGNKSITLLFQQALSAHKAGEMKHAQDLYEDLLTLQPLHANAMHGLGMLAAKQQQWDSAINWIEKALTIEPNSAYFHHHLANAFKNSGKLELALSHYQTALYWSPQYAEAHNNLAGLFYQQNKLTQASQHYMQAIHLKPDYLEAHFNLALLFLAQKEKSAAITQFNKVLRLYPNSIQAHWQLAHIYWQDNHLEKVQYHYQKIFKLGAPSSELLNNFAALMLQKNQTDTAIDYFKQALAIDPKHKAARSNLAASLLQKNQIKEAIWHYSLYINLEPFDKEALFNRAHGLMLTGQLYEALDDLKKILTLDNQQIDTHCNLAAIYLKLNNKTAALAHYQIILTLKADHSIASYMTSALTQQSTPDSAPIEYIKNLFDNYAFQFDAHLQDILSYKTPQLLREQLNPYLENKKYKLLDLGCGTGLSGVCFTDITEKLVGIDISANMLSKAKEKACYDILIEKDIISALNDLEAYFDLILCIDTLVYFGDLNQLFAKITLRLPKNGLLACSVELADGTTPCYTLQTTGRYQHTEVYLQELTKKNNLKLLKHLSVAGRQQEKQMVKTGLFIFQKT